MKLLKKYIDPAILLVYQIKAKDQSSGYFKLIKSNIDSRDIIHKKKYDCASLKRNISITFCQKIQILRELSRSK